MPKWKQTPLPAFLPRITEQKNGNSPKQLCQPYSNNVHPWEMQNTDRPAYHPYNTSPSNDNRNHQNMQSQNSLLTHRQFTQPQKLSNFFSTQGQYTKVSYSAAPQSLHSNTHGCFNQQLHQSDLLAMQNHQPHMIQIERNENYSSQRIYQGSHQGFYPITCHKTYERPISEDQRQEEERKEQFQKEQYIKELESKLATVEEDCMQFKVASIIGLQTIHAIKELTCGFNEESFHVLMSKKYIDAGNRELKEKSHYYKKWQYIIHFVPVYDKRIKEFRAKYGDESRRQECHQFCLSLKKAHKLFRCGTSFNVAILFKKELNRKTIEQTLYKFMQLRPHDVNNIMTFMDIFESSSDL